MTKNYLLLCIAMLAILASCSKKEQEQADDSIPKDTRPNIVYIMTDDHTQQAISAYGSILNKTPNIDRIAQNGAVFTNSYVCNSICAPSRAAMLTGKHSHKNGQYGNSQKFDSSQVTFPKLLQSAGYQTALVGKWHLKSQPQGFDYWSVLPGQGDYYNPDFNEMGTMKRVAGYVSDLVADFSIQWLSKRDTTKPFCLLMHQKAPHRNWMPAPRHLNLFKEDLPLPDNFFDDYATRSQAAVDQKMSVANDMDLRYDLKISHSDLIKSKEWAGKKWKSVYGRMDSLQRAAWDSAYLPQNLAFDKESMSEKDLAEYQYQRYIKDYLRCVAGVDESVGEILDYLEQNGLSENTIVVYTSDQGFYLGEHGWFDKRFMYEESFSTPLIVQYPKVLKGGSKIAELVQNIDYAPTFLELAGISVPEDIQGESFVSLLKEGESANWRNSLFYQYHETPGPHNVHKHYGVRKGDFKLIHFFGAMDDWELYDLKSDPNEMNNLYGNPEYKSTVDDLKAELNALKTEFDVPDES